MLCPAPRALQAFAMTITDKADLEGLPDTALGLAAQTAKAKGHESATAEAGPWVLTLDIPSYLPAMQHLKNRDLREQLYRAYVTRASAGDTDNSPIITRTLQVSPSACPSYCTAQSFPKKFSSTTKKIVEQKFCPTKNAQKFSNEKFAQKK